MAGTTRFELRLIHGDQTVPAVDAVVTETRTGGWELAVYVSAGLQSMERTFSQIMGEGLTPGQRLDVHLVARPDGEEEIVARRWPCVITAVAASLHSGRKSAIGILSLCDPVTALSSRPLWCAYAGNTLAEVLGGAVRAARGDDPRPGPEVLGSGDIPVRFVNWMRSAAGSVKYVIASGETLGAWVGKVCGVTGARLEFLGDEEGRVVVTVTDAPAELAPVNVKGPLKIAFDPAREPSPGNLSPEATVTRAMHARRAALLDNPHMGDPRRLLREGSVETVLGEAFLDSEEGAVRATFRGDRDALEQIELDGVSRQPGMVPGRIVAVDPSNPAGDPGPRSWFGAQTWQVRSVSHVYTRGTYWNLTSFEKTGFAWRPRRPSVESCRIVSGIVDDGSSKTGARVARDAMGRIPVRIAAAGWPQSIPDETTNQNSGSDSDDPWPARLWLSPIVKGAGAGHGVVDSHRQGDWCRIEVANPFFAEVAGSVFRDDRPWRAGVEATTLGWVTRQDRDEPEGVVFQADETLPEIHEGDKA